MVCFFALCEKTSAAKKKLGTTVKAVQAGFLPEKATLGNESHVVASHLETKGHKKAAGFGAKFQQLVDSWQLRGIPNQSEEKGDTFSINACHPCAGTMLIFSVSFQF